MQVHKIIPLPHDVDFKKQSFQVPRTKRPGQTGTPFFFHRLLSVGNQPEIFFKLTIVMVCQSSYRSLYSFDVLSIVAIFGYVDLDTPGVLTTLPEVFESGYAVSKNSTFLGQRPVVSKNPLTYAHHYVWQTYAEVDEKRRHIGSAIHTVFENGTVGGGEYPTVGLWSSNRPGIFLALGTIQYIYFQQSV